MPESIGSKIFTEAVQFKRFFQFFATLLDEFLIDCYTNGLLVSYSLFPCIITRNIIKIDNNINHFDVTEAVRGENSFLSYFSKSKKSVI